MLDGALFSLGSGCRRNQNPGAPPWAVTNCWRAAESLERDSLGDPPDLVLKKVARSQHLGAVGSISRHRGAAMPRFSQILADIDGSCSGQTDAGGP